MHVFPLPPHAHVHPPTLLSSYGQFFLKWYSQSLISHGDAVLATAVKAFPGTSLAAKVAGEWVQERGGGVTWCLHMCVCVVARVV